MSFDPTKHFLDLKGKKYLPVNARIAWFRDRNPAGGIQTSFEAVGDYVLARAHVVTAEGIIIASGSATVRPYAQGKDPRDIEKAETAAIGRALAVAGYGTMEAGDDLDENNHLADSPVQTTRRDNHADVIDPDKVLAWYQSDFNPDADMMHLENILSVSVEDWQAQFNKNTLKVAIEQAHAAWQEYLSTSTEGALDEDTAGTVEPPESRGELPAKSIAAIKKAVIAATGAQANHVVNTIRLEWAAHPELNAENIDELTQIVIAHLQPETV